MIPAKLLKPAALLALVLAIAAGGGLAALRAAVDAKDIRAAVTAHLDRDGARTLAIGSTSVRLWPRPAAVLDDVAIGGDGVGGLAAPRVTALLRLLPLMFGRVEIAELVVEQATIDLRIDDKAQGRPATSGAAQAPADRPDIAFVDSIVTLRGAEGPLARLDAVEGRLDWRGEGASLAGRFRLHGQPVETQVTIGHVGQLRRGEKAPLRWRVSAPAGTASFDGQALMVRGLQLDGALAAEGAALRNVIAWFGREPTLKGGLGRFALKGQAQITPTQLALSQASLELDGDRAEGGLTVRIEGGRPAINGSIAADTLTLTPYLPLFDPSDARGDWRREPLRLDTLAALNVDVRLSAGRVAVGATQFGRVAASVLARGGRLSVTLGEAQVFAGSIRGALTVTARQPGAEVRLEAVARDLDLDRFATEVFALRRLEGKASAALTLEAQGASMAELARSAGGSLKASAAGGAITGINLEQILRRVERRPLARLGDIRGGRTGFDQLSLSLRIAQGTATCEDARLESASVRVGLAGAASLSERAFDLRGTATLARSAGPAATPFELPFVVRGPWHDPAVLPDAESLIRRSGAAAPLLDAARERAPAAPAATAPAR